MPASAERQIKRQGGAARYRTVKSGGKTMTCAVTRKSGPKGGKTVCWPKESAAAAVVNRLLENDDMPRQKHRLVVGVTLDFPEGMQTADALREFLDALPERLGRLTVHDARILRGAVDQDDVRLEPDPRPYDKVR